MSEQTAPDLSQIPQKAIGIITNPVGFYRKMPKTGGFLEPIVYVVIMAAIAGVLTALFSIVGLGASGMIIGGIAAIIVWPILAVIGSFIGAGIVYVIWLVMGSKESFETAYRCVAYTTALYPIMAIVGLIPYIGTIIGTVWGFYLIITATIEVHQLQGNLAYAVFGIIGAVLLILQLSAEYTGRNMADRMDRFGQEMEDIENMDPEEAGKAMGEFLKGLEEGQQQ